ARITVSCCVGSLTLAVGRAIATIISARPIRNRKGGIWRRTRWPTPSASRTIDRLAYRTASRFLRRSARMYRPTSAGISARSQRNSGQRKDIVRVRARDDGARREATAALAQVGEAQ